MKEAAAKRLYSKEFVSHSWDHIKRVHKFARIIAKNERNVDYKLLDASVWLHDIARPLEFNKKCKCHAEEGAKIIIPILKKAKFSKEEMEKVSEAIAVHRYSGKKKANSIESKILQDADRLDALGAIAIARIFTYGGAKGRSIEESLKRFYFKQIKLKPETFNTKTARRLAKQRYSFIKLFLKEINKDIN